MIEYKTRKAISECKIVPVVVINDAARAPGLAKALCDGGLPIAEITFRTDAASEAIKQMCAYAPELLVGAGTVHSIATAELAVRSGAQFIVTAGYNEEVVDWCVEHGIDIYPGCVTPSDLERLMTKGLSVAKFFPAEAFGGKKTLKAFAGPYGEVKFIPTGGIDGSNIKDYLALDSVLACGGAWIVPAQLIDEGRFEEITKLCKEAKKAVC